MKNLTKSLIGIMILCLVFTGCKKEKELESYLKVGDVECTLTDGNIVFYGELSKKAATPVYSYYLEFCSQGIALSTDPDGYPEYTGTGVKVILSLYSAGTPRPASGIDYEYHEWSDAQNALNYGGYIIGYTSEVKGMSNGFVDGTVTVKGSGDNYTITYVGKDEEGTDVLFQYSGKLTYYDGSDWATK